MDSEGKAIVKARDSLRGKKSTYNTLCDDVARYFAPEMETLTVTIEGGEMLQPIVSTGILALQRLVSGLYSNSMAMGKGNITSMNKNAMEIPIAKEWYDELSNVVQHHISQSSFARKFNSFLGDYSGFGGGVMYPQFHKTKNTHDFLVFPENKCFYTMDANGEANAMYREYAFSAGQAVSKFGYDKLPERVQKAYDDMDVEQTFDFVHCMRENRKHDSKRLDSGSMKYESIHVIEGEDGKVVKKSGSKHFRYIVEHFYQKEGELNGRSPAMQCLPVMRTLMKVVSDHIDGTELAIGPPMFLSDKNAVESAILEAFSVNYADLSKGNPWIYQTDSGALAISKDFIDWLREEVNQLFFVDLFTMLENQKAGAKTAYEVSQMVAERTQAIAPIANGLSNFFRKVYYIVAHDLIEAKQVDAPPDIIAQEDIDVNYTSRLDIRLKEIENVSTMEAVGQATELVTAIQASPYVQAVVKPLEAVIAVFDSHNVDPSVIRNLDDAEEELNAIFEQIAQQKQDELSAGAVKPIDLQAGSESGSPMDEMIESGAGGMISQ